MKKLLPICICSAIFALPPSADALPADLDYVKVRAADAAELARLEIGVHQSFDYGSFLWLGVDDDQAEVLAAAGLLVGAAEDFTLELGGIRFDPHEREGGELLPAAWRSDTSGGDDLHLVQWIGPVREEWLTRLRAAGVEPIQYIHPHTYVVWGRGEDLAAAHDSAATSAVRWVGAFETGYRVLPRWRALTAAPVQVDVLLVRNAGVGGLLDRLRSLGGEDVSHAEIDRRFALASLRIAGDRLAEVARLPGVYSVQLEPTDGGLRSEMSNQVNAGNVDVSNIAFPGYQTWLSAIGLSGAGVRMANVDSGVQETHPDLAGRMVGCTGTTCSSSSGSHGTHTAGIMAADGSSGVTDGNGFLRGLGMAPGAELFEQNYDPYYTQPGGMLLLIEDSHANGAVLSGNSWGPAGSPRGYDNDTLQVDIGVRDADDVAGNQSFSYVLSFMNGGGGTSTQGSPDEAKNLFNIGSTKMRTGGGAQDPNINDLSYNTAHGPALDGRTIPHMVAPGCWVDSTLPTNNHGLRCGTSMASPHVAGAVGLFFEYYRGVGPGSDPSPALVKAAFLPVAHDLAGNLDADGGVLGHPFDSKQGWGRMDAAAVLDPQQAVAYFDNPAVFDNSGEMWSRSLTVDDPGQPVRLMLVWTDAPGHGLGGSTPAWNNDLDLEVDAGGTTYLGNVFGADGLSTAGGTADDRNNTEGVFLDAPTRGGFADITVRVLASDINSDGIPGEGDGTDQDFSLVCYNCRAGLIFADGFESGDASRWSSTFP